MDTILRPIRALIPRSLFEKTSPVYHRFMAWLGDVKYGHPSRHIKIVGVTGTKGKSTTTELVNAILEEAGFKTALTNTLRFKIGKDSRRNLYKMSMPGRFFMQKFLREAVDAKCEWAVLEMTSQGAAQSRHRHIELDALIFNNLSPEHIESHGSYEAYVDAKLSIGRELVTSPKNNRVLIANADDQESRKFLALNIPRKETFSLRDTSTAVVQEDGTTFVWNNIRISSPLPGEFNLLNMLAAATFAKAEHISGDAVKRGLERTTLVRGRVEKITLSKEDQERDPRLAELAAKQDFTAVVDYAHTADSLEKLYKAFDKSRKICVLGNTGGGRDKWKRPEMAKIAERYCDEIILTNEDPYDENPREIINDMLAGIEKKEKATIIMDRREAIRQALAKANRHDVVLISGKGTDPYIMEARGKKTPWDDAAVVREELEKILAKR